MTDPSVGLRVREEMSIKIKCGVVHSRWKRKCSFIFDRPTCGPRWAVLTRRRIKPGILRRRFRNCVAVAAAAFIIFSGDLPQSCVTWVSHSYKQSFTPWWESFHGSCFSMIGITEFLFNQTASQHQKPQLCPSVLDITINNRISASSPILLGLLLQQKLLHPQRRVCHCGILHVTWNISVVAHGPAGAQSCSWPQPAAEKNKNSFGKRIYRNVLFVSTPSKRTIEQVLDDKF